MRQLNPGRRIDFCTLAGVENVKSEEGEWPRVRGTTILTSGAPDKGPHIVGRWKKQPTELHLPGTGQLAYEFANYRNDEKAILRFTKKYGPLRRFGKPEHGNEFRFPLSEWRAHQKQFKHAWESMDADKLSAQFGSKLIIKNGQLRCETSMLLGLLLADLFSCPRERLKKCSCPDCLTPYFIAHHLGQRFCSDVCAAWAQRKLKQAWWKEHGDEWRKAKSKRRTGPSGGRSKKISQRGKKR